MPSVWCTAGVLMFGFTAANFLFAMAETADFRHAAMTSALQVLALATMAFFLSRK